MFSNYSEKIRYLIAGGLNTVFGLSIYPILSWVITDNQLQRLVSFLGGTNFIVILKLVPLYLIILTISYILSVTFAYITTKLIVFRTHGNYIKEFVKFSTFHLFVFGVNLFILPALVEWGNIRPIYAQPLFTIIIIIAGYIWHRRITFLVELKEQKKSSDNNSEVIPDRYYYFDGLRGVASLAVFLGHSFLAFFLVQLIVLSL